MLVERGIDADTVVGGAGADGRRTRRARAPAVDNGPEMTAHALRTGAAQPDGDRVHRAGLAVAEPVRRESFHSRVRDELLDVEEFSCLAEAES